MRSSPSLLGKGDQSPKATGGGACTAVLASLLLAACSSPADDERAILAAAVAEARVPCILPLLRAGGWYDVEANVPDGYRDLARRPAPADRRLEAGPIGSTPVREDPRCALVSVPVVEGDRALVVIGWQGPDAAMLGLGLTRGPGGWTVTARRQLEPIDNWGEG